MDNVDKIPKRVLLRLRVSDFTGNSSSEYDEAIKAYLAFAQLPITEISGPRLCAHIEPFQNPELQQRSFHITLDMEPHQLSDPEFDKLPHELYRVRRNEDGIFQVEPFRNPVERDNFIKKMRRHTDKLYQWGAQRNCTND